MTIFDLTAPFLRMVAAAKPFGSLIVAAEGEELIADVAEFHLRRGARNGRRLAYTIEDRQ